MNKEEVLKAFLFRHACKEFDAHKIIPQEDFEFILEMARVENFQKSDYDLTDDRKLFDWASKQCYFALGNMMTAAALIGIDSCPIEGLEQKPTEAILEKHLDQ